LNSTLSFSLADSIKGTYSNSLQIKSVQFTSDGKVILVGTAGGEIWEISTKDVKNYPYESKNSLKTAGSCT
jgi:hypothetical protein